jgi:hypothetical protein
VIKSRILRWARLLARVGKRRSAYRALVGKPEEDAGIDERIILKLMFERLDRSG